MSESGELRLLVDLFKSYGWFTLTYRRTGIRHRSDGLMGFMHEKEQK